MDLVLYNSTSSSLLKVLTPSCIKPFLIKSDFKNIIFSDDANLMIIIFLS